MKKTAIIATAIAAVFIFAGTSFAGNTMYNGSDMDFFENFDLLKGGMQDKDFNAQPAAKAEKKSNLKKSSLYSDADMEFFEDFGKESKTAAAPAPKSEKKYSLKKSSLYSDTDMEFFEGFDMMDKGLFKALARN